MTQPRILSLCSGYGGLDLAVEKITGGRLVAYAENDPAASQVMAAHWPGVPNLGSITEADWDPLRGHIEIIAAGFPCQGISNAGKRKGLEDERSGIWRNVAEAVGVLRPRLVFLENVAALRVRGLDTVAQDLAECGYDLRWTCVRASDVADACHNRHRWFGLARPSAQDTYGQSAQLPTSAT